MPKKRDHKCYNCGKYFANKAKLERHKHRKTPCLIANISEEDKLNPNRCIYCNRIFANTGNRDRHYSTCKIKNGGVEILYEKIKHEEDLKEENEKLRKEKKELEEKFKRKNDELEKKYKLLEEKYEEEKKSKQNIHIHNNIINNNNNIIINVVSYNNPEYPPPLSLENVRILGRYPTVSKFLLDYIWFNKKFPQNHTILPVNVRRKETIVYDGNDWTRKDNDEVLEQVNKIVCYSYADNAILDGPGEEFIFGGGWDECEEKVPEYITQRMRNHTNLEDKLEPKDIFAKMLNPIVLKKLATLKQKIREEEQEE
jgi:hypothetical protein